MKAPQHDRADELENERELTGDIASAVRDFSSEEVHLRCEEFPETGGTSADAGKR